MATTDPDRRHFHQAATLHGQGQLEAAIAAYDRAVAADPGDAEAHSHRGIALAQLGRTEPALAAFTAALAADPGFADALVNRAVVLGSLGRAVEALAALDEALAIAPGHAPAAAARGVTLAQLNRNAEAILAFDRALAVSPDDTGTWFNRAIAAMRIVALDTAIESFDAVLARDPGNLPALCNKGFALGERGDTEAGIAAYDAALALAPGLPNVAGQRAFLYRQLGDWERSEPALAAAVAAFRADPGSAAPPSLVALVDDPELHVAAARAYLAGSGADTAPPGLAAHPAGERLRVAYVSGDFHDHATMYLIADMLAAHDRSRFEITLLSYGPQRDDAWQERARTACDAFIDLGDLDDRAVAQLARDNGVDVAIDLKGMTGHARPGIFAARAAPVQIGWLGHPGSMASLHDYLVADAVIVPAALRHHYPEALVRLPGSYQPNSRRFPAAASDRAAHGLPATGMVYCCFNQSYKITPAVFADWMAILAAVPGSVLWLWIENATARANVEQAATAAGIDSGRLVFAARLPMTEHLARLGLADVALDTSPYNSHTTASDALGMGVPLITCPGTAFPARVAASLLHSVGLDELAGASRDDYVALAVTLGNDPARLAGLRARLAAALPTAPLFDAAAFARHFEAALTAVDDRQRRGLPPADIAIAADHG